MFQKILKWFARIVPMLAILVMVLFSFDSFGGDESVWRKLLGFLIHNIPSIAMIIALVVAWRHEVWGGVLFVLVAAGLMILFKTFTGNAASMIIVAPILLSGIVFILYGVLYPGGSKKAVT